MKLYFSGLLFACLLTAPAWAATGTMIKDDEMRTNASANSAAVGRVAKGASVAAGGAGGLACCTAVLGRWSGFEVWVHNVYVHCHVG